MGIILLVSVAIIGKTIKGNNAAMPLGLLMIVIAIWVMSESSIRQFVFSKPSLTEYFSYLTVELMGAFACMYFDAVQHKKYHKVYRAAEAVVLLQLILNLTLQVTHVKYMYETLIFSHLWTAVCIIVSIVTITKDCISKDIRKYKITAVGMACFILMAVAELASFYITRFRVTGTFVCVGLILLMTFTVIQALYDEMALALEREKKQVQIISNTIETIAGSIDAKDEYTGGHSERVGLYAERLAREIAADFGFSEEDILRIKYIGLVHDIGKIGVADTVLNKAGRLTDEEFIRCSGTQFDPALTEAFVRLIDRGELKVNTENGMSIDENGVVLISSKLENRLQSDLLQNKEVPNPTHVRMMCYVIKLMEKKGKKVSVLFYGPDDALSKSAEELDKAWEDINSCAKEFISGQDMIIRYNRELNVLALFDRDEIINPFVKKLKSVRKDAIIKDIDDNIYQ